MCADQSFYCDKKEKCEGSFIKNMKDCNNLLLWSPLYSQLLPIEIYVSLVSEVSFTYYYILADWQITEIDLSVKADATLF